MMDTGPSLADLQALSRDDLGELVLALLSHDDRAGVGDVDEHFRIRAQAPEALIVVNRAPLGGSPLAGVSLTGIRRDALADGLTRAEIYTTGVYTPGQRAEIDRAINLLHDFEVVLVEGTDAIALIGAAPEVQRRFFPTAAEAAESAEAAQIPQLLVNLTERTAPHEPDVAYAGLVRYGPLLFTSVTLAALIAVPIRVCPTSALIIGSVALAVAAIATGGGLFLGHRFDRPEGLWRTNPLRALLFVPDRVTLRRRLRDPVSVASYGATLFVSALVLAARSILRTSLALFVLAFASLLLLLWGIDPTACVAGAGKCSGAFAGMGSSPSIGDFVYLSVHGGLLNQPPDPTPASRVARSAITLEFVLAASLIGSYAAATGITHRLSSRLA